MSEVAIRVNNLSKCYQIGRSQSGEQQFGYRSLRDVLAGTFTEPIRHIRGLIHGEAYAAADMNETLWALKDVSFEIKQGEVVGIIGRNGAGKSTLLKILSRITEPTHGEATIYGRVGSLLEVGTGFHPELTGRENIYLNGAILGMKQSEINHQFDEIVAFAEVEKFIDTPVKHYSSGMYLRLAFGVAAHLEPEILLVDEVLAVGDAQFQKKCLGKMEDVAAAGRTVLFVSHNMGAMMELTQRCLLLNSGGMALDASTQKAISQYLQERNCLSLKADLTKVVRRGDSGRRWRITHVEITNSVNGALYYGSDIELALSYYSSKKTDNIVVGIGISNIFGTRLVTCESKDSNFNIATEEGETGRFRIHLDSFRLSSGEYILAIGARTGTAHGLDYVAEALFFEIKDSLEDSRGMDNRDLGYRAKSLWSIEH